MTDSIKTRRGPTLQRSDGWYAILAYGPFETQEKADNFARWMAIRETVDGDGNVTIDVEPLTVGEWAG